MAGSRYLQGIPLPESFVNDAQMKALLRKTQAAAEKAKPNKGRTYDATLDATRPKQTQAEAEAASDAADLFQQMKKREF